MSDWFETKFLFDDQIEAHSTKQRLITFLNDNDVQNVVESYYDGLTPGSVPEEVEADIFGATDSLPLVVYSESEQAVESLLKLIAEKLAVTVSSSTRRMESTDSVNPWTDDTVFATERFVISPEETAHAEISGRTLIRIRHGQAFGNGQHVTTLAILRTLEKQTLGPTVRVLDVGTGCGVLLIAAAKLGALHLCGTDLSAEILQEARHNLQLNNVQAVLLETSAIPKDQGSFDIILANIPVAGLRPLLPSLLRKASPRATFIFSGFTTADGRVFQSELSALGLEPVGSIEERGWVALALTRLIV